MGEKKHKQEPFTSNQARAVPHSLVFLTAGLQTPAETTIFRFQQQICLDHGAVQTPFTGPAFSTLKDAVRRLLPYHTCAGHLPTQDDFNLG